MSNKLFMAESELIVRRLIESGRHRLKSAFLSPQRLSALSDVVATLDVGVQVFTADERLMREISGYRHHGGALATGHRPAPSSLTIDAALGRLRPRDRFTLVLCEGITNVDNVGAIFRSAAAFGADGVVLDPACADPFFRLAIRVSMGHVFSMPWATATTWAADLRRLRAEWRLHLVAAETDARARLAWDMPRASRLGIVVGSERMGLARDTLDACDTVCAIPMSPAVSSLNVAAAAAIMLYEANRPR